VRLDVARIDDSLDLEALALMFLIEKVDAFARGRKSQALLIGDLDNEKAVNRAVQNLSVYRADKTKYAYGRKIEHVADTIHFARSHHSRLNSSRMRMYGCISCWRGPISRRISGAI
jgi:hypothetical protein